MQLDNMINTKVKGVMKQVIKMMLEKTEVFIQGAFQKLESDHAAHFKQ